MTLHRCTLFGVSTRHPAPPPLGRVAECRRLGHFVRCNQCADWTGKIRAPIVAVGLTDLRE